jgi:alpha-beta hydrolase superfamily lysophospholipase
MIMMSRRTFSSTLAAAAIALLVPSSLRAQDHPAARNVVLVHGLFADGSSWAEVIGRLKSAGLNVTSVHRGRRGVERWPITEIARSPA